MFYKNNETKEIVYLVKSDNKRSIVFKYNDEGETSSGIIINKPKKEFKKHHTKFKKCTFNPPEENMQKVIIQDYETNKYAYDNHFEDYIEEKKYLDRKEELEKQTEAERRRIMKELADDYVPNKKGR